MIKNAIFDGWDFAANGLTVHLVDMYSRTPKSLQLEGRAVEDGLVLVSSRYGGKPVTIEGTIIAADSDALENMIDTFLLAVSGEQRILDIPHGTGSNVRRFIATAQAPMISREATGATLVGFSVEFIVPEGYGSDVDAQTLLSTTITTAQSDQPITVGGSYKAQPDITLTLTSVTGGTPQKSISVSNADTTEGITITRNWTAGDVVQFNARDRRVYVNNTQIYTTGAFPSWPPGNRVLTYSDDFSARSVNVVATYQRRWL